MEVRGCHYIDGRWKHGSESSLVSINPANGDIVWKGSSAGLKEVDNAVMSARAAAVSWASTPLESRIAFLKAFAKELQKNQDQLATAIGIETGKPLWEANNEVIAMSNKVDISIDAYQERCSERREEQKNVINITRHRPHGVIAVFGPFNFPGHLPNGHIIPALLAGNTVIFKPSEMTPLVAEKIIEIWHAVGLPPGVLNLIQGGRDTGQALAQHPQLDGLLFTGSARTGSSLLKHFSTYPEKILALEMGGNNPLVVTKVADVKAAAYITIMSAFLTSGQRCTCVRRLIVPMGDDGDHFLEVLCRMTANITVGFYNDQPQPLIGPVISRAVAKQLLTIQDGLLREGATCLRPMTPLALGDAFLSPGIIDVTQVGDRTDEELFGPLLQVIRVRTFADALTEANNTRFGLAAGLLSDNIAEFEQFSRVIRAGVINWNTPTTGASSRMPFGGVGISGNHRPSAYYAADYCAYPVASMEATHVTLPTNLAPGITL
ncbi:MAG: succinylglutamate-semialdehyde dehydrogenase [Nitrosomonas sp.]|nr:MAG: succinylglutamate-semialdehyde dehydrogenase [Nitrosomonas sp.]